VRFGIFDHLDDGGAPLGRLFEEGKRETSLILGEDPDGPPRPVSVESDRLGLAARHLYEHWASAKTADSPISLSVERR